MIHVVKQCIINQTQGYWLFFNALNVTLSINVCMWNQTEQYETSSISFREILNLNDNFFCMQMTIEIFVILIPFLSFTFIYKVSKFHNILALMLDPLFKYFDVVKTFARKAKIIHVMVAPIEIFKYMIKFTTSILVIMDELFRTIVIYDMM